MFPRAREICVPIFSSKVRIRVAYICAGLVYFIEFLSDIGSRISVDVSLMVCCLGQGVPPRGQYPNPVRDRIADMNALLPDRLSATPNTTFFNIDASLFVNASDGTISHHDMYNYLHLSRSGIPKLAEPLLEEIEMLLKNFLTADSASLGEPDI